METNVMRNWAIALAVPMTFACNGDRPTTAESGDPASDQQKSTTSTDDRDAWQKPEEVIALMGDIKGQTIGDLFADDGYFTFKLIDAGANVIAIVNDQLQATALGEMKKARGLGDDRLRIRAVPAGDPGLQKEEVDIALIVHHYTLIQNKIDWFARMREGCRHPRPLIMVEWLPNSMVAHGPPDNQRMGIEAVMDEVGRYGYSDVGAHSAKIPEQVIYIINDYMDFGGPEVQMVPGQ